MASTKACTSSQYSGSARATIGERGIAMEPMQDPAHVRRGHSTGGDPPSSRRGRVGGGGCASPRPLTRPDVQKIGQMKQNRLSIERKVELLPELLELLSGPLRCGDHAGTECRRDEFGAWSRRAHLQPHAGGGVATERVLGADVQHQGVEGGVTALAGDEFKGDVEIGCGADEPCPQASPAPVPVDPCLLDASTHQRVSGPRGVSSVYCRDDRSGLPPRTPAGRRSTWCRALAGQR